MKPLKCTLTPNRSDRRRHARYVTYRREGNTVVPFGHKKDASGTTLVGLDFSHIAETRCDTEFEAAWRAHVATQSQLPEPQIAPLSSPYRAQRIAAGHIRPRDITRWSRSPKRVIADAV